MQCTSENKKMSFGFDNINSINKAQSAYKDGGGMGGGGMYMKQGKKRKDEPDEDMFEYNESKDTNELSFDLDIDEQNIAPETMFNKFVNWFRLKRK